MKFLKLLLCRHEFEFIRNIYGDEIIDRGGDRSIWRCQHCGVLEGRGALAEGAQG